MAADTGAGDADPTENTARAAPDAFASGAARAGLQAKTAARATGRNAFPFFETGLGREKPLCLSPF